MNSRERLLASLKGEPADRPGVNFYEIGGFDVDPGDPDPFNIYSSPSWRKLLGLAQDRTDLIPMRSPGRTGKNPLYDRHFRHRSWIEGHSRFTETVCTSGGRTLTSLTRRDREMDTVWVVKHLLSDADDVDAYLQLPREAFFSPISVEAIMEADASVGERGMVMVDTGDPICAAASLFSMEDYTILALTDEPRFRRLLDFLTEPLYRTIEEVSSKCPGMLYRIYGPEYATEPYLPPRLFDEYVNRYDRPMIEAIHRSGGYARFHCHGRLRAVIDSMLDLGIDALDPTEPPPQGDMTMKDLVSACAGAVTIFGGIEVSDIENMDPREFAEVAASVVEAGAKAKGFVLMPSSSPYGRTITDQAYANYETLIGAVEG